MGGLPAEGGALLGRNGIGGDQFFLVPGPDGRWSVSAFRGLEVEHRYDSDSDLGFGDRLHLALAGGGAAHRPFPWTPGIAAVDIDDPRLEP
ncbi:hypothetical protein ACIGXI_32365 [Kitasatospora aureofaciens]|uniref:hypothetical protein n=1 Tax=Kitasatospora aureofaciens TaxID=1894 RepID=UPI0037CC8E3E